MYLNYCQKGLRVWGSSKINKSIWNTGTISSILHAPLFSLMANPKASWKVLFIPPLEFPCILRHNNTWDPSSFPFFKTFVTSSFWITALKVEHFIIDLRVKVFHAQKPWRSSVKLTAKQRSYYAGSGLILPPHGTGPAPVLGEKELQHSLSTQ